MDRHLYLTAIPEALVASMLEPEEFGRHLAMGSPKRIHGPAMFFEIRRDRLPQDFDLSLLDNMQPHPDGSPKKSLAVSEYRVMERIPLEAFGSMFLVSRTGLTLERHGQPYPRFEDAFVHLYQELCPIYGAVVSKMQPDEFARTITDPRVPVSVPKILFADLLLGRLADPESEIEAGMLPYAEIGNIKEVVHQLRESDHRTLVVAHSNEFFYRTIDRGFFVADSREIVHYPFITEEERAVEYHNWWHSAETSQAFSPVG